VAAASAAAAAVHCSRSCWHHHMPSRCALPVLPSPRVQALNNKTLPHALRAWAPVQEEGGQMRPVCGTVFSQQRRGGHLLTCGHVWPSRESWQFA
jgi:hypothetical protein